MQYLRQQERPMAVLHILEDLWQRRQSLSPMTTPHWFLQC